MHVCLCVNAYKCMCIRVCLCSVHVCLHLRKCVCVFMHTYMRAFVHVCMFVCTCAHIRIYMNNHIYITIFKAQERKLD